MKLILACFNTRVHFDVEGEVVGIFQNLSRSPLLESLTNHCVLSIENIIVMFRTDRD